jgi:hypothetical protein
MAWGKNSSSIDISPVREASKHSFIPIDDIVVVLVGCVLRLPENRSHWPVRFVSHECIETCKLWHRTSGCSTDCDVPYVLCGVKDDIVAAFKDIKNKNGRLPMYFVTDTPTMTGFDEFCVASMKADIENWEEVVATICSLHISTIPQMIVHRANNMPNEVAVISSTSPTALTYSQLVVHAWLLGEAIMREISKFHNEPLPENVLVGFIMPPSSLSVVTLLALGLRRMGAVVIASKPSHVTEYQLTKVRCHALLVVDDSPNLDHIANSVAHCVLRINEIYEHLLSGGINSDFLELSSVSPPRSVDAMNDVSIIEWTSGSTGKPKAMAVTAWRLSHWIRWRQFHFPFDVFGSRVGVGLFWAW